MATVETPEALVKFLSTWPDRVLEDDWRSALGGPCGDDVVKTYVHLRRRADGWSPRKMGPNNHREVSPAALAVLVNGPATGDRATCERCRGTFTRRRSTARYCSGRCQRAASRARQGTRDPMCLRKARIVAGQKGCKIGLRGSVDLRANNPSGDTFTQTTVSAR